MPIGSYDGDDVIVKGDDGTSDGKKISQIQDGAVSRLAVDAKGTFTFVPSTNGFANTLYQNEITVATKVETDLPNSTYTVPTGKTFALTSFGGSYDTQSPMYLRFKKQTGGAGNFATLFRITLKQHGQDESNHEIVLTVPLVVGVAGDVFKITYESALAKGTLWAGFAGVEY